MLISEAMVMLAPVGVERIDRIPNDSTITPVWKVRQNGADYIYCAPLDRVVWALTPSDDWEG
jgi:hypothetical protein